METITFSQAVWMILYAGAVVATAGAVIAIGVGAVAFGVIGLFSFFYNR